MTVTYSNWRLRPLKNFLSLFNFAHAFACVLLMFSVLADVFGRNFVWLTFSIKMWLQQCVLQVSTPLIQWFFTIMNISCLSSVKCSRSRVLADLELWLWPWNDVRCILLSVLFLYRELINWTRTLYLISETTLSPSLQLKKFQTPLMAYTAYCTVATLIAICLISTQLLFSVEPDGLFWLIGVFFKTTAAQSPNPGTEVHQCHRTPTSGALYARKSAITPSALWLVNWLYDTLLPRQFIRQI